MIRLEIQGGPALERALKLVPVETAREISFELKAWANAGTSDFTKKFLNVPDDRNRGDFLLRRPKSSKGLRKATIGHVAQSIYGNATVVDRIADINATVGFRTGKGAQLARVHELGTIRYGGKLPDIVPKRGKYLKARIYGANAGRSVKGLKVVNLKKVGIPPRLGWVDWWTSPASVKALSARIVKAAQRAMKKAAPSRG